jgi:hypothetical protein
MRLDSSSTIYALEMLEKLLVNTIAECSGNTAPDRPITAVLAARSWRPFKRSGRYLSESLAELLLHEAKERAVIQRGHKYHRVEMNIRSRQYS